MKMNYTDALTIAINILNTVEEKSEETTKAIEKLTALHATYTKRAENRPVMSDEKKAELSAKRKAETAAARAELIATCTPVLRSVITGAMTAKEIYAAAKDRLPADMTANRVQHILLHEMRPELVVTEAKGRANTYALA